MQRAMVGSGEMQDLKTTSKQIFLVRNKGTLKNNIPLTRLLLDSNFVSITDILFGSDPKDVA